MKLYCFTPAGSGASFFNPWKAVAESDIEIVPFQLPGREDRFGQAPLLHIEQMASLWLRQTALPQFHPYAVFGHSMGAMVAFEALRMQRKRGLPAPALAIYSAHQAPHLEVRAGRIAHLPEAEFLREVVALGGIQPAVLAHPELVEFILPALRSDFAACENYRFVSEGPLGVPFLILAGESDPWVDREGLAAWSEHTSAGCRLEMFPGNHFYFQGNPAPVIRLIREQLRAVPSRSQYSAGA
jgi:medium-chain acyl-[acyl-carrier-protein] hydrolase